MTVKRRATPYVSAIRIICLKGFHNMTQAVMGKRESAVWQGRGGFAMPCYGQP